MTHGSCPANAQAEGGYQAATWTEVTGVVSIGEIGFPHATIEVPELATGITKTYKGARTGSAGQIAYATRDGDAGQTAVAAANEAETEVSLRIDSPDGTVSEYWTGIVHSLVQNAADVSSYEGGTFTFVPNYAVVKGDPPE